MHLVVDLRYAYIDDDGHDPTVGDMVTSFCGCPELCRREKTVTMFPSSFVCFCQFPPVLPDVKFGLAVSPSSCYEFLEIKDPMQSYFSSCNAEHNISPTDVRLVSVLRYCTGSQLWYIKVVKRIGRMLISVIESPF